MIQSKHLCVAIVTERKSKKREELKRRREKGSKNMWDHNSRGMVFEISFIKLYFVEEDYLRTFQYRIFQTCKKRNIMMTLVPPDPPTHPTTANVPISISHVANCFIYILSASSSLQLDYFKPNPSIKSFHLWR